MRGRRGTTWLLGWTPGVVVLEGETLACLLEDLVGLLLLDVVLQFAEHCGREFQLEGNDDICVNFNTRLCGDLIWLWEWNRCGTKAFV